MSEDKEIKVILLGETGVGKTNLIRVATGDDFNPNTASTVTNNYSEGNTIINEKTYKYNLWDTAGQEKYRSMNKLFVKNSKIIFIVFSIASRKSFEQIDFWYKYIKDTLGEGKYIVALIGNKSDLYEEEEVLNDEVKNKANELNIKFKITSAKTDVKGFKEFLDKILEEYINKYLSEGGEGDNAFKINSKKNKDNKDRKKCC